MSDNHPDPSREQRVDEAIAAYLEAAEAARAPSREELLARHPDLADELALFLDDHAAARRLAGPPALAPSAADTMHLSAAAGGEHATLEHQPDRPAPRTDAAAPVPPALGAAVRYVGEYELLEELGRGGMGVVYRARQASLKRPVALKMILAGGRAGPADLARFQQEAEAVARVRHPHIVQIYEVGAHDGLPYMALEFCPGGSLAGQLDGTPWPPRRAAPLVQTLARAAHAAHAVGVIHRDLKPANVLLADDGAPKVTDFGLAKQFEDASVDGRGEPAAGGLTQPGAILGTPSYMAPEQAGGHSKAVGRGADVYALGAILYELLTGRPPFRAATALDTILQVATDDPVSPARLNAKVPRDLETICLKCLEKDPARRYPTAEDLADELGRFERGEPIRARPIGRLARGWRWCKRNPVVASLVVVVVFVLLGGTIVSSFFALESASRADANYQLKLKADALAEQHKAAAEEARKQERKAIRSLYAANMNLAQTSWEDGKVGRVLQLLKPYRKPLPGLEDVRGWEWFYQDRLCHDYLRTFEANHAGGVGCMALSPDGQRLATASSWIVGDPDRTVTFWNPATGQQVGTLDTKHAGSVATVAFSPDGKRLVTGSWKDKTVKIWDVGNGKELHSIKGHTGPVLSVAFSPDGQTLASAGSDQTVILWDAASCQKRHVLKGHTGVILHVAFSPDGKQIASASADRTVKVWQTIQGAALHTLTGHTERVWRVAFSPTGNVLASTSYGDNPKGELKVWDLAAGREMHTLKGTHSGSFLDLAFSPDGVHLVGTTTTEARVWRPVSGRVMRTLKGTYGTHLTFSPDGQHLISAWGKDVMVWDLRSARENVTLQANNGQLECVAFSPDGTVVASAGESEVQLWDAATGQKLRALKGHTGKILKIAFNPNGTQIASAGADGTVRLWDVTSGQGLRTFGGHPTKEVRSVAFSPDGTRLASAYGHEVKLWDVTSGQALRLLGLNGTVRCVAFSPDGTRLATADAALKVKIWDAVSGKELVSLPGGFVVAFSPDGSQFASSGGSPVYLWDAAGGKLHTLEGHPVLSVAYNQDGTRLATAGWAGTVKVWDTRTGLELRTLAGHDDGVTGVAFSPRGRLASSSKDGTIRVWDARSLTATDRVENEAIALVEFLFARPLLKRDVIQTIRQSKIVREAVRQQALKLAERFHEETDPDRFASASRNLVRHRYLNSFQYQFALRQAQAACHLRPNSGPYLTTLGMAQYRLGQHPEALQTLTRADQLNKGVPANFAFLAMTHHELGQSEQAQASLNQLRESMKVNHEAQGEEAQAFLREAALLIEAKPAESRK